MKNTKSKINTDPKKESNVIKDQFKQEDLQKERKEHKDYKGEGYGEDFKDKDYNGANFVQEDDYNSNKLGNGSDMVNKNSSKKPKRKPKE